MKKYLYCLAGAAMLLVGCSQEERMPEVFRDVPEEVGAGSDQSDEGGIPGIAYVKVSEVSVAEMQHVMATGITRAAVNTRMTRALADINANKLEPLFPMDPRFEKRTRKAGLDRWFIIRFDEKQDLDETLQHLSASECFEFVEKSYLTSLPAVKPVTWTPTVRETMAAAEEYPFTDEFLPDQWHYKNYGNTPNSVPGADINLFEAWKYTTGDPKVIVAVIDGGVDVTHEDLVDNIWVNENEIPDNNIDDDGNGKIDDIHGYNFVDDKGTITPGASGGHGTHVAGIIAARNGNGKGVCGIAGGDETHPGVSIMSCEKFNDQGRGVTGEEAFYYAANNGAVICQNSWGYTYPGVGGLPQSMKDAIDYFIDYAGCDDEGNQLPNSPMKGGLVLFAAGNDGKDYLCYPSAYERVVAVSAMAPDWTVAFYSNKGAWVDIMAPGGDLRSIYGENNEGQVLSTLPAKLYQGNGYGYMQGTSMACPHVSGVAALIVSEFGGQGFTNDDLRKRLEGAIRPENIDEHNPDEAGRLGVGYIDAGAAFATNGGKVPADVTDLTCEPAFTSLTFQWTAVTDEDDHTPVKYHLYVSEEVLTESNLEAAPYVRINATNIQPGTSMSYTLNALTPGTAYHVAMIAIDRWGQTSAKPLFLDTTTKENHAPKVTGVPTEPIRVGRMEEKEVKLTAIDEDGHTFSYKLTGNTRGVTANRKGDVITLQFRAAANPGKYTVTLILTDELKAETSVDIPFEVEKGEAPTVSGEIPAQTLQTDGSVQHIDLAQYFTFAQGTMFTAKSSNENVVKAVVEGTSLSLTPHNAGEATVTVMADNDGQSVSTVFAVSVNELGQDYTQEGLIRGISLDKRGILSVMLDPQVKQADISIRTVMGEEIYSRAHSVPSGKVTIDTQHLSAGVYTLIVESAQGTAKKTFVKQ